MKSLVVHVARDLTHREAVRVVWAHRGIDCRLPRWRCGDVGDICRSAKRRFGLEFVFSLPRLEEKALSWDDLNRTTLLDRLDELERYSCASDPAVRADLLREREVLKKRLAEMRTAVRRTFAGIGSPLHETLVARFDAETVAELEREALARTERRLECYQFLELSKALKLLREETGRRASVERAMTEKRAARRKKVAEMEARRVERARIKSGARLISINTKRTGTRRVSGF